MEAAIHLASECGHVPVLDWWVSSGLELKYTHNSMDLCSGRGHVDVLDWWANSGLQLTYSEDSTDLASKNGRVAVLDWWLKSGLEPKHSGGSMNMATSDGHVRLPRGIVGSLRNGLLAHLVDATHVRLWQGRRERAAGDHRRVGPRHVRLRGRLHHGRHRLYKDCGAHAGHHRH
jgi:hypothetical protein